jgi:hypothetical protein
MPAQRACLGRSGVLVEVPAVRAAPVSDCLRHPLDADREQIERFVDVRQGGRERGQLLCIARVLAQCRRGALQLVGAHWKSMARIGSAGVCGHEHHRRPPVRARPSARDPIVEAACTQSRVLAWAWPVAPEDRVGKETQPDKSSRYCLPGSSGTCRE